MGTIKDKNYKDLVDAEDIKKRWKEYTELYKKDLSHPEPDILELAQSQVGLKKHCC